MGTMTLCCLGKNVYVLSLVLIAALPAVHGKMGDARYRDFAKKFEYRYTDNWNDNYFKSLRDMKIATYRKFLTNMPNLVPLLEKYGIFEQLWNIISRHLLEILDEVEEVLSCLFDRLRENKQVRNDLLNVLKCLPVPGYVKTIFTVAKWFGKKSMGWARNWVQAEVDNLRARVEKLYNENKPKCIRKTKNHKFPVKIAIQNPRKLGEEPPKKSLIGNLFGKVKHCLCREDASTPKIQLGPNVSVRGIPALELVNLPNDIGYCIQIEKKYVTPGISKAHIKSPQAQVTIHQPGGQLHPEG